MLEDVRAMRGLDTIASEAWFECARRVGYLSLLDQRQWVIEYRLNEWREYCRRNGLDCIVLRTAPQYSVTISKYAGDYSYGVLKTAREILKDAGEHAEHVTENMQTLSIINIKSLTAAMDVAVAMKEVTDD